MLNCTANKCVIHCDDAGSCQDTTLSGIIGKDVALKCDGLNSCENINFYGDESNRNISIECNGASSCMISKFYLSDYNNYVICGGMNSCLEAEFQSNSWLNEINYLYSCKSSLSISCIDKISKCNIYCKDQHTAIYADSFTIITRTAYCIDEDFSNICGLQKSMKCLSSAQNIENNQYITTKMIWSVSKSDQCIINATDNDCECDYISSFHKSLQCRMDTICDIKCESLNCQNITINAVSGVHIFCGYYECMNLVVNIGENSMLYLECDGNNACLDIVINGKYAKDIDVQCIADFACFNINIDAEYVGNVELECGPYGSSICEAVNINTKYAQNVSIKCNDGCKMIDILATFVEQQLIFRAVNDDGIYAADNVTISAINANYVSIYAVGDKSFVDSTIYAQNANKLIVSCYGAFTGQTCVGTDIHLSSNQFSNTLNCEAYGCKGINLYFEDEIDLYLFNCITFNGCSVCKNIDECIWQWTIFYNNNDSAIIYTGNDIEDEQLIPFNDYIHDVFVDDMYYCNDYEQTL